MIQIIGSVCSTTSLHQFVHHGEWGPIEELFPVCRLLIIFHKQRIFFYYHSLIERILVVIIILVVLRNVMDRLDWRPVATFLFIKLWAATTAAIPGHWIPIIVNWRPLPITGWGAKVEYDIIEGAYVWVPVNLFDRWLRPHQVLVILYWLLRSA